MSEKKDTKAKYSEPLTNSLAPAAAPMTVLSAKAGKSVGYN
jgi:hypothetical protein